MDYVHTWGSYGWGELPWGSSLYERSVSDTASAVDASTAKLSANSQTQETATAADTAKTLTVFNSAVTGSVTASDTTALAAGFAVAVVNGASASENTAAKFLPLCVVAEVAVAEDVILGGGNFDAHIVEAVVPEDVLTFGGSSYNIGLLDGVEAVEQNRTNTVFKAAVTSTAVVSDSTARRLLWEPINTGVDEDWTFINTNL